MCFTINHGNVRKRRNYYFVINVSLFLYIFNMLVNHFGKVSALRA